MSAHPQISSLIRFKDKAREEFDQNRYYDGLKTIRLLLLELKKEDQSKTLKNDIKEELLTIHNIVFPGQRTKWVDNHKEKYLMWYEKIIQILWDKNYLENEKYGMHYTGRPSQ